MPAAERLSKVVALYAQSHGLTLEDAVDKLALAAEEAARPPTIGLTAQQMEAVRHIQQAEAEKRPWDTRSLALALKLKSLQHAQTVVRALGAKGVFKRGVREVLTEGLVLVPALYELKGR